MSHLEDSEMSPGAGSPGAPIDDCEPGCSSPGSNTSSQIAEWTTQLPEPTLYHFLLNTPLNSLLAAYLPTRDLFFLQFLNRTIFTLLNSNAFLLKIYYQACRLDSFIPFMVDDAFLQAFLTPTYLDLPDGSRAVRNTYSMHIRHLYLNFCTRISNHALSSISTYCGANLLTLNLEGGGRSRINEHGMRGLFQSCPALTTLNLNGFYQLNMVDTIGNMIKHCTHLTDLSLNGCSQMNDQALQLLARSGLKLSKLYLNCSNVTDASLQHLANAFKDELIVLHVGYCGSITDRGLASLVNACRRLEDLNLYGCYGLSRHALSYLRLCPFLQLVDISRIHALDDSSIAEWILPTAQLQHQQQVILQLLQQNTPPGQPINPASHPDYNPNLPQIFAAQAQHPDPLKHQHAVLLLRSLSLDSCSRISSLGLKILLENCPSLQSLNAFGVQNLTILGLQSLLRIVVEKRSPLKFLEIGGCTTLNQRDVEVLRKEFSWIKF